MSKYKAGDKVVLDILATDEDGYYKLGNEIYSWWDSPADIDIVSEPLSTYTDPLEAKIRRQASQITRLLADNAELKKGREAIRDNAFEAGLIRGHEDAWKLAHKIFKMDVSTIEEIFIETGAWNLGSVLEDCTYSEAAAKVAEWEKQEEICVGDVVRINNANRNGVVICEDFNVVSIIIPNGSVIVRAKEECTKTGRHIDVDAWLAQIGGGE